MTQDEALQEARRRWPEGHVYRGKEEPDGERPYIVCDLNTRTFGIRMGWPFGMGDSWEAAFADADRMSNIPRKGLGESWPP